MQAILISFRCVSHGFVHLEPQTLPLYFVTAAFEWGSTPIADSLLYLILQCVKDCNP